MLWRSDLKFPWINFLLRKKEGEGKGKREELLLTALSSSPSSFANRPSSKKEEYEEERSKEGRIGKEMVIIDEKDTHHQL